MSYILGLSIPDHQAITDLRRYLETKPDNLNALMTANALERFFFIYGERILIKTPEQHSSESGYIRFDTDEITNDRETSEPILGEQMYIPPSPEEIIANQAHRVTEVTIQYGVGDLTKLVSYKLADPTTYVDMSNIHPTGPRISVDTSDIDPKELQERIRKITDDIVAKSTQRHKPSADDDYTTRGIGLKKAMSIADNPTMYNTNTLEFALHVLRDHILTQPYSSDIARK